MQGGQIAAHLLKASHGNGKPYCCVLIVINYSMELSFMSQHILIELAKRKPYSTSPEMPKDAVFDSAKGYWLSGSNPLVSPGSKYGALVSKKCDQETGEDQKGE